MCDIFWLNKKEGGFIMEAASLFTNELTWDEVRQFVQEGLNDMENNRLLDFDEVFDKLERRYKPH